MSYARLAGVACLIGGFFLMIDAGIALLPDGATCPLADIVGACAKLGVIAGTLGFLSLRVARPGWLAIVGAGLALAGTLTQIAGVLSLAFFPHADQILTPLGSGLITLGMTGVGIATLRGRKLPGWQAWTPLFVGLYFIAQLVAIQIPFVFSRGGQLPFYPAVFLWGIPWMLLGYVIFSQSAKVLQPKPQTMER
jgi:hypothetical protein